MSWVFLSLLGAVGTAVYFAVIKKTVNQVLPALVAAIIHLLTAGMLLIVSLSTNAVILDERFYMAAACTTILNIIGTQLLFTSLKTAQLSLSAALFSLSPLVLIASSYILLQETPTFLGFIGIVLLVLGLYQMNLEGRRDWLDPFKKLLVDPALRNILIVVVLFGISSAFDKQTVLFAGPYLSSAIVCGMIGVYFLLVSCMRLGEKTIPLTAKYFSTFAIAALLLAGSSIVLNIAMTLQLASYVLTLKRLSAVVSLFLGVFFFKETIDRHKIIGILMLWIGSICIIMG